MNTRLLIFNNGVLDATESHQQERPVFIEGDTSQYLSTDPRRVHCDFTPQTEQPDPKAQNHRTVYMKDYYTVGVNRERNADVVERLDRIEEAIYTAAGGHKRHERGYNSPAWSLARRRSTDDF